MNDLRFKVLAGAKVSTGSGSDRRYARLRRACGDIDRFLNSTPAACVPTRLSEV
jgi:hypothetical protein